MFAFNMEFKILGKREYIMHTVFVLDDEPDILELIKINLNKHGFKCGLFERAFALLEALKTDLPDILVLDLMLPDLDGIEVCKRIRTLPGLKSLPIIMLTAKVNTDDRIYGLDSGADDYLTKPFSPDELIARINALLRRKEWETENNILAITPDFRIDFNSYEVFIENKRADLTRTEFKILQLLTKQPGRVYTRTQILDYLWGNDKIVIDRTIDVHIKHLREKIGRFGNFIRNIRGVGYKFDLEQTNNVNSESADEA